MKDVVIGDYKFELCKFIEQGNRMSEFVFARDFIVDFLRKEIIGPSPGYPAIQMDREEILRAQDPPRQRYSAGVLFPMKTQVSTHDKSRIDEETSHHSDYSDPEIISTKQEPTKAEISNKDNSAGNDHEINLSNEFLPSAMGLSALVEVPKCLKVDVEAGTYRKQKIKWQENNGRRSNRPVVYGWWRRPLQKTINLYSSELLGDGIKVISKRVVVENDQTVLDLHVVSRPQECDTKSKNARLITFSLINRRQSEQKTPDNEECFFQCGFKITAADGQECFRSYPEQPFHKKNEEDLSLQLLYLHRKTFAVGHGCAADWKDSGSNSTTKIWTEVMPAFEIKPVLPTKIPGLELFLKNFAFDDTETSIHLCTHLCVEYEKWISEREQDISLTAHLLPELKQTAEKHLDQCKICLKRMEKGVTILKSDPVVSQAFRQMNEVMLMQYAHYSISSQKKRNWKIESGKLELEKSFVQPSYQNLDREWHPFQLAFILMSISAIVDPYSPEREIVDIIWFPTGGGKTEAYLGLSAFSILLRRLQNPLNAGTNIIMRYTLRLLTTQQFQRAASLICACEVIRRRESDKFGKTKFSIGLWVGSDVTPNSESEAVYAFQELCYQQGENKFVLLSCPWCGAAMGPHRNRNKVECKGYKKLARPNRIRHVCADKDCEFSSNDGLPIAVIDEHIYNSPPTILIGTVDKFAMMPFRPESRHLFGIDKNNSPPDLIIQDELHLVSGPLGSMVGHYETLIDALCMQKLKNKMVPAKVIASTATISRASSQVKNLYGRDSFLFPPQALKIGDTFFAEERNDEQGRLYVGVFATALPSHITAQVRTMGALLQAPKLFDSNDPRIIDPYWTMMGYFNSLRELGHAATLVRADIREFLNALWDRLGLQYDRSIGIQIDRRRFLKPSVELTSRVPSSEIPAILERLFSNYDASTNGVVDICFATNMIQVGIDVPRLSLMTIIGQPKTTSEYIQASSRVGRDTRRPGIVITNYNTFRPRDRSHYEHFRSYHQEIYRHVEPTSVTPFSTPVKERALHALVVALCRFWGNSELRNSPKFPPDPKLIDRIKKCIKERVMVIDPSEWPECRNKIDEFVLWWSMTCPSKYGDFAPPDEQLPLMYPAGKQPHDSWQGMSYPTPSSMRNVDASCEAYPLLNGFGTSRTSRGE